MRRASPRASLDRFSPACRIRLSPSPEHAMPGVRIVAREYSNPCGRTDTCEVNASATTATWSPCPRSHTQASSESEAETAPHGPRRDSAELAARPGAPARTGRSTPPGPPGTRAAHGESSHRPSNRRLTGGNRRARPRPPGDSWCQPRSGTGVPPQRGCTQKTDPCLETIYFPKSFISRAN